MASQPLSMAISAFAPGERGVLVGPLGQPGCIRWHRKGSVPKEMRS